MTFFNNVIVVLFFIVFYKSGIFNAIWTLGGATSYKDSHFLSGKYNDGKLPLSKTSNSRNFITTLKVAMKISSVFYDFYSSYFNVFNAYKNIYRINEIIIKYLTYFGFTNNNIIHGTFEHGITLPVGVFSVQDDIGFVVFKSTLSGEDLFLDYGYTIDDFFNNKETSFAEIKDKLYGKKQIVDFVLTFIDEIKRLIISNNIKFLVVSGHSLGGGIAVITGILMKDIVETKIYGIDDIIVGHQKLYDNISDIYYRLSTEKDAATSHFSSMYDIDLSRLKHNYICKHEDIKFKRFIDDTGKIWPEYYPIVTNEFFVCECNHWIFYIFQCIPLCILNIIVEKTKKYTAHSPDNFIRPDVIDKVVSIIDNQ
jgi:hypothetical protein